MPDLAPEAERILREVYAVDLRYPPAEVSRHHDDGRVLESLGKAAWEVRSPDDWRRVATAFGFHDVLTYSSWILQLPVIARSASLTLYNIPLPAREAFRDRRARPEVDAQAEGDSAAAR
jgi:hypothetical protein